MLHHHFKIKCSYLGYLRNDPCGGVSFNSSLNSLACVHPQKSNIFALFASTKQGLPQPGYPHISPPGERAGDVFKVHVLQKAN